MSLAKELGFRHPIGQTAQEAVLNIVLTGALLSKEGDRLFRPMGLTDAQFNVLMLLKYQSENGEMNQTALGSMLLVNRSNVTGLIDRMEQAGWVKRTAQTDDRRVNLVRITAAGLEILEQAENVYFQRLEEVMSDLNDKERYQLCNALERIRAKLAG
ncbi:MAG: MarR family transcriptional regulator [Candidatus Omnitrophota bacterium]|jgi:DNA-binding MarR family transcriptional regulator|nr:MAG: MarR family transcriptional regulator [Candidatus Omnitrophota bacterium]